MSQTDNMINPMKTEDYTLYKVGSLWKCIPRDIDNPRFTGLVPETLLQGAVDELLTVGGVFQINDSITELKTTVTVADVSAADHIWEFRGRDYRLTRITAHADLGATPMFEVDRGVASWADQDATMIRLRDIYLNPNNIASTTVYAPWCLGEFRGHVYIYRRVDGTNVVGRIGGSGGPGRICHWDGLTVHYVGGAENVTAIDCWFDRLRIEGLEMNLNGSSSSCRGLYMNGEYLSIGHVGAYVSPASTVSALVDLAGVYASIGQIALNDGAATVSLVKCNASAYCSVGQARYSGSNVLWADAQTATNSVCMQDLNI